MAGFRKAKAEQAALKVGLYGPSGSGKTFTSLLFAEGLSKLIGKRVAFVDTERGTDFYCQAVQERKLHPEAFDFDALYTRSISEVISSVKSLDWNQYGIVVIDSITHIWEAAIEAYKGKTTSAGTIPFHAWGSIKKPYKDLITFLLNCPAHVFFCGRQGNEFDNDEDTGELKKVGVKMKAEGETPYEPHILIRMEGIRNPKTGICTITAFAEKDRTGVISGKTINNPTFESVVKPLLGLLGDTQAKIKTSDENATEDAEKFAEEDMKKEVESSSILQKMLGKIMGCETAEELAAIGKEITKEVKAKMTTAHVTALREKYLEAEGFLGKVRQAA